MKVLIVLTSHDQLGNTGKKTGFWLEEFAAPYYVLKDAGVAKEVAAPESCPYARPASARSEERSPRKSDPVNAALPHGYRRAG